MAYQAKRSALYTEDFELIDEGGKVVHTLRVALDPDSMATKLSEKHVALVKALQDMRSIDAKAAPDETLTLIGTVVFDVFSAVFGVEGAECIVGFYGGRYLEMCTAVMPFVTDVVIPKVRQMAADNKKSIKSGYRRKMRCVSGRL